MIKLVNYKMTLKIPLKKYIQRIKKKDKTINEYASLISEIRKEYNMLYKENQDLKTEMQILRNYYDREKLIRQNKKAMKNFPSRAHNRKMRYQRSYESSGNEETDDEEKYYVYSKKKKPRKKYYDDTDGDYDDIDDDIEDYAGDEEFSENDNDNNDNDEKRNKNQNNKKVIQKQKRKPRTQNKKGISKSIKV